MPERTGHREDAQNGTVSCAPTGSGDITEIVAPEGSGLTGGATAGCASLGLARRSGQGQAFDLSNDDGFGSQTNSARLVPGNFSWAGFGKRMFWYPSQAAFRAGVITEEQWDEANIGGASVAFGSDTTASGTYSVAMGTNVAASGTSAIGMGANLNRAGARSVALGTFAVATAEAAGSFVYGDLYGITLRSTAPSQFLVRASGELRSTRTTPCRLA